MAGIITQEHDLKNGRVISMWSEAGIQFRSNLLLYVGAQIVLHSHSYAHVSDIRAGVFDGVEVSPEGVRREYIAAAPMRITVPAGYEHQFILREKPADKPGEICCMWGG